MSWNDLKPAEITQKLPETSHIILFLVKINYFQVAFVIIFHAEVFFGQIWFQKQKFYPEHFAFLILRILELHTRKVREMFVYKHTETIKYVKK